MGSSPMTLVLGAEAPPRRARRARVRDRVGASGGAGETETTWFERHGSTPITDFPSDGLPTTARSFERRIALIESDPAVGLIERPEHKRRWNRASWEDRQHHALTMLVARRPGGPRQFGGSATPLHERTYRLSAAPAAAGRGTRDARRQKDADLAATVGRLVLDAAVPHLAAQRLTDKGLRKGQSGSTSGTCSAPRIAETRSITIPSASEVRPGGLPYRRSIGSIGASSTFRKSGSC